MSNNFFITEPGDKTVQKFFRMMIPLCALLFFAQYTASPHVVMLSFLSYPGTKSTTYESVIQGIPITYFGNRTISDHVGLATFWYQGEKQLIYLLVCNEVEPVMIYHNTVDYWKIVKGAPYSFYVLEKKYDENLKIYFWDIQKVNMEGSRIPVNTIIIHVNPEEIYVPTGVVVSSSNLQLVLPAMYVKEINISDNVFRFTAISQFFSRMDQAYNLAQNVIKVNP